MKISAKKSDIITGVAILLFIVVLLYANLMQDVKKPEDYPEGIVYEKAVVVDILSDTIQQDPYYPDIRIGRQDVVLEITTGAHAGRQLTTYNLVERIINNPAKIGTRYVVSSFDDFITASIVDYDRESTIYGLSLLFVAAVVLFGRKKGVYSLLGLVFTLLCILFLFIPLVVHGMEPIAAAIITIGLSAVVSLWLLNGWCDKTVAAIISCTCCTMFTGLLAFVTGALSRISTMNTPEAEDLLFVAQGTNLSLRHLLFAGILFAALGAVMDTAMSITSSVFELRELDSSIPRAKLFESGMNIGRDIMGTMTNTLILAFTGGSLNTIIIFYLYAMPSIRLINMQFFVIEVIRGMTATTGVVCSIPVAAAVASAVACRKKIQAGERAVLQNPAQGKKNGRSAAKSRFA